MILIIGDLHFKEKLGYSDYIKDGREKEKKEVLDLIVKESENCDTIVMLGDQLNGRNNLSSVLREFVKFIERFGDKDVYMIAGNHERFGDGRSALDFLKEIKNKKRYIITKNIEKRQIGHVASVFCPYYTKAELGAKNEKEASDKLMKMLPDGDILFIHHAISDSMTNSGVNTNLFSEIVLPKKELEKKYKMIFGGHIHKPQVNNNTIIAGSIFNNEVGETGKKVWKIAPLDMNYYEIDLPGRKIYSIENPVLPIKKYKKDSIIKCIITDKKYKGKIDELKKELRKFDAYILLEQYPRERKKVHFDGGGNMLEFNTDELLGIYAEQRKINIKSLLRAWETISKMV